MTEVKQQITINDAINEFYRLKDKYETDYNEKFVIPIIKSKKSKKEKRVDYSRLPKPECINCKRNVGTIFSIKPDFEEDVRKFVAKCGDIKEPCPLDIQLNYSIRNQLNHSIVSGYKTIEEIKLNIIKEKNNALFFNKNVMELFEQITDELKNKTESMGFAIETNILRNDNPEKALLIKRNLDEFGKGFILPFKSMIADYMDTSNEEIINQAIGFYINEMLPKLKEIQEMKYSVNFMEYNPNDGSYKLIQYPNSLENGEFFINSDDKVVKFVKGIKNDKKSKTMKNTGSNPTLKKTRKIRPIGELVIEDEDVES